MKKGFMIFFIGVLTPLLLFSLEGTDSSFYPFARELAEKYHIKSYRFAHPWSRQRIKLFIEEGREKEELFTPTERELFDQYAARLFSGGKRAFDRGLVNISIPEGGLSLSFQGRGGYISGEKIEGTPHHLDYLLYTGGIRIKGASGHFDFGLSFNDETMHGDLDILKENMTRSFYDETGEWVTEQRTVKDLFLNNRGWGWTNLNEDASELYFDRADTYVSYTIPGISVTAGKQTNAWGPGESGSLFLSSHATSYNQVRFVFDWGPLSLVSLTGGLRSHEKEEMIVEPGADPKDRYRKKYLAAHRLEYAIGGKHHLAFQEGVIYADKAVQLGYALPFNFFWSEQHYEGDRDNVIMGMDGRVTVMAGLVLHGEILLDDLSVKKLSDFRRTKSAYTVGMRYYPHFFDNAFFSVLYTRINPLVYTHRYNIDNYTHYGSLLGHVLGPNSDDLRARVSLRPAPGWSLTASVFRIRFGLNYINDSMIYVNVGGDVQRPDLLSSDVPEEYAFLGGAKKELQGIEASVEKIIMKKNVKIPFYEISAKGGMKFEHCTYHRPDDLGENLYGEGSSFSAFVIIGVNYGY